VMFPLASFPPIALIWSSHALGSCSSRNRKAKTEEAHGEFESEHPGYCGAQDTFYVGNLKGVGRIYQQSFIDTYTKVSYDGTHKESLLPSSRRSSHSLHLGHCTKCLLSLLAAFSKRFSSPEVSRGA
jgi:hypothetical protein